MSKLTRGYLIAELVVLFVMLPVVLLYTEEYFPLIPSILVLTGVLIVALRFAGWQYRELLVVAPWRSWRNMLLVWGIIAILWATVVFFWRPDLLFSFPKERPDIWLLVMFLYPLVSALPQEIIYRTFFFSRYAALLAQQPWLVVAASGLLFMWGHLLFMNWFAFLVTLAGGLTFAWRYYHTRSLILVAVEHGLYGNLFFTLGLGQWLYSGAV